MTPSLEPETSWVGELRYLVSTFPRGTRGKLGLYAALQFVVSLLDLAGLAAVLPVMQVISGASLDAGYIGGIHRFVGEPERGPFAVMLCAAMVLAFLAKSIFALAVARWSFNVVARLQVLSATKLLHSYLTDSYLVQRRRDVGGVVRTVGAAAQAAHANVLGGVLGVFGQLLSISLIAGFLFVVAPGTTLGVIVYSLVAVTLVQQFLAPRNRRAGAAAQETAGQMSHALLEAIYGAREVRMHKAEQHFLDTYGEAATRNAAASRDANFYAQTPKYVLEFVTILGIAILLCSTALTGGSDEAMPTITLFVAAAVKLLPSLTALTATLGIIRFGIEGLHVTTKALRGLNEAPRKVSGRAGQHDAQEAPGPYQAASEMRSGDLIVDDVRFRYPDGVDDVLKGVSFVVPEGSSLAVCGLSGSGKTTLVDIVLGLIEPISGQVSFDGLDIVAEHAQWLDRVAYVPQDVYLLAATLWENVAFGADEQSVDRAAVEAALRLAQLGELVDSLPGGIDAVVGFQGTQLSGGQKQRVGIARALYRRPQVLVLDEATSALDNETEDKISTVIRDLHGRITVILVAHRLSTVKHADCVMYLEDGRIVGSGSFEQLQTQSHAFARLVRLGRLEEG